MVSIDESKCTHCDLCSTVCPDGIILAGPTVPADRQAFCAECGHCVAACPSQAISLASGALPDELPLAPPVSPESAMALLLRRRSTRSYKSEPLARQHLEAILAAAATYPSSANIRPVKAYVVTDATRLAEVRRATQGFYRLLLRIAQLPGFALVGRVAGYPPTELKRLVHGLRNITETDDGRDRLFHDAVALMVFAVPKAYRESVGDAWLAAENAVIYAETIPVGTCYNGFLTIAAGNRGSVRALLGVPRGEKVVAALTLGYPRQPLRRRPPRPPMPTTWS
ncbi:MAG: nitroreductase family protein [Anaerolineae bacterium]